MIILFSDPLPLETNHTKLIIPIDNTWDPTYKNADLSYLCASWHWVFVPDDTCTVWYVCRPSEATDGS